MSLSRQPSSSHDIFCLCLLYESSRGNVVKHLLRLLQPLIVLNSVCCAVLYLRSCCLGMGPILPTSEYLTSCRPTLQCSGRVRPVSKFPKCMRGVLLVVIEMKALPVQQRTALHQARSSCRACCPFLTR